MSVFICDKDTCAIFDKFLPGFYGSHKVNLQNFYVSELTKWFVFEAVQKHKLIKHSCSFIIQYIHQ